MSYDEDDQMKSSECGLYINIFSLRLWSKPGSHSSSPYWTLGLFFTRKSIVLSFQLSFAL